MPEQLRETVGDWHAATQIEHETRTIRNVALSGIKSENGYRYRPEALRQAIPRYEHVPVFLDHPDNIEQPRQRSTRDLAGRVRNVRFAENRLRGDLELFDTEAGRTLLALAASEGPGVGMSHVVLAERSGDGTLVERILDVISVDAVVFPATTTTFREGREGGDGRDARDEKRDFDHAPRGLAAAPQRRQRRVPLAGSLEELVTAIDRELPAHLERLAVRSGLPCPGRGRRIALYPEFVIVEWRAAGHPARRAALRWRREEDRLRLGNRLRRLETIAQERRRWTHSLSNQESKTAATVATSRPRRATSRTVVEDGDFVQAIRGCSALEDGLACLRCREDMPPREAES